MELIRWLALAVFLIFSLYTLYLFKAENFWKSLKAMIALKWGRQVIIDLYIGLFLFGFFVYLNEGSILITACWLLAFSVIGNPAMLFYFIINYSSLVAHFGN
jgi:hypothetical protein